MGSYAGGHNARGPHTNRSKNNHEEPKQKRRPGTASNEITGGLQLVCGRPTLALSSALVPQTLSCLVCVVVLRTEVLRVIQGRVIYNQVGRGVGYENHNLNPYQILFCLVENEAKDSKL